ncbi:M10 family metallopeptidase C-terminal domain-containing protein [Ramlibacter albus]|uniref:M10 family metallopeptidase C-terminal domain-containing protein n=1 Tax=Ramlibacter albus TaxID=2079448 RepID=A0A923S340_9BURK|nr:M10 family metallopeptidase C-terminal domain-containing protein [Ramlibacter albus]MBC5765443.1 M10 family metallopeptidase C-terminal domain-containing protein [Ramlibacter albus]
MPLINGTAGADTLTGGPGEDVIDAGDGNDTIDAGAGPDSIRTGDGIDTVQGGDGDDDINGYWGADGPYMYPVTGSKVIDGGNGDDLVVGGTSADTLLGGAGDDYIVGRDANDSISGGAGDDMLAGDAGDDTLSGGAGVDLVSGGLGNDTYYITDLTDFVWDTGGTDRAIVSASFVKVPSMIESVTYVDGALALPYWIDALVDDLGNGGLFGTLLEGSGTYSYAFPASQPSYDTHPENAVGWQSFGPTEIASATAALAYISSVVDLRFLRTADPATYNTIAFANNSQPDSSGWASPPNTHYLGSDVFISLEAAATGLTEGTAAAATLIHELGHALGLKHPHGTGTGAAEPPFLGATEDLRTWTIMSYNGLADRTLWKAQFRDLDIAALQYLYGPSRTARAGNDTYTLSESRPNFIWDGAGTDTIDASSLTKSLTLYLAPGYWGYTGAAKSSLITAAGQVTVNFGTTIENAIGTAQADTITGNEVANVLEGRGGNDTLVGGAGSDTAAYRGARGDYTIAYDTATSSFTVTDRTAGRDGVDQLRDIESLRFSDRTVSATTLAVEAGQRSDLLLAMGVYRGLNGAAPSSSAYTQVASSLAGNTPASYAAGAAGGFASMGGEAFTTAVMANFGITASALAGPSPAASYDALKEALTLIFTLFAPARGQVVLNMTTLLRGLESDAVFGGMARTWNARVTSDLDLLSGSASADDGGLVALVGVADAA